MQVGNGGKLFGCQSTIECVKTLDAPVFVLQVGHHKADIGGQVFKERTSKCSAQHRDTDIRVLMRQRIDDGHHHGNVAHC